MADENNSDSSITGRLPERVASSTPDPQTGGDSRLVAPPSHAQTGEPISVLPASQPQSGGVPVDLGSLAGPVANTAPSALRPEYLPPGTHLRGWTVEKQLGKGGMGAVYMVRNDQDEIAALKLSLPPAREESTEEREARIRRFVREFGAVIQLEHPHIVKPFEFFTWPTRDGHPCIVMPHVEGKTLGEYMHHARPSLRVVVSQLLNPVADALDYIHSKDIFHRDVKPANIMVRDDGVPLLMDFGIARSRASSTLTSTEVLTTYEYAAPEYLGYITSPERSADLPFDYRAGADLFCLGSTFFNLLTGRLPYQHVPGINEPLSYMSATFQRALPEYLAASARALNDKVPEALDELLARMMARDPAERFKTGGELLDASEQLLKELPATSAEWDQPFVPPPRVRQSKQQAEAPSRRSRPPPPPAATRAEGSPGAAKPNSLVAPSLVAPSRGRPAFQPPTSVPEPVFKSVAAPKAPAPVREEAQLSSSILAAQQRLMATGPRRGRSKFVVGGLLVVVVVLLIAVIATVGAPPAASPTATSLLDEKERNADPKPTPPPMNPIALTPAIVAPLPEANPAEQGPDALVVPPPQVAKSSVRRGANPDAQAIDSLIATEYGGKRPTVGGGGVVAPALGIPKKKSWVQGMDDEEEPAAAAKSGLGIPTGTEIPARITRPLDSRTAAAGPAIAKLTRPFALRGRVLLPSGTMVYGVASPSSAGRFDVRFTRMKLPDGHELEFDAIAYDIEDKKPGLQPTTHTRSGGGSKSPSLGGQIVKNTASAALGQLPGDAVVDMAKGAGQTILSHEGSGATAAQEVLTLEAPVDFALFVREPF